jgi:uncharacterized protein (UPF0248 family)
VKIVNDHITRVDTETSSFTEYEGYKFFDHNNYVAVYKDEKFRYIPWHRIINVEGVVR